MSVSTLSTAWLVKFFNVDLDKMIYSVLFIQAESVLVQRWPTLDADYRVPLTVKVNGDGT